ncbi:alpha-2-antiplasmin [Ahaetulla prasina]|uniref:alpha-2-antiplasmin n=1 Tax=Ahaetulla prasina TaxID=499056 RepID=UPI0026497E4A|nr:alpha-2-antiplasmin [Ahaetulla prasina]XP_058019873.1 alpha-2-antiplasmin [Ahaetulla prasina]XP_058019874.1 alpha-2-antiplasmin [Ahaetulla prasina]
MNPLLRFRMALVLWTLLAACLPSLCAGQDQATHIPDTGWDEGAQRNTLLVHTVDVLSEDDRLPQAGTESQRAIQDPTKLSPHFPDEAAGQGKMVPGGSKELGGLPNSLEGEEEGCQDQVLSESTSQIALAMKALGVDLLREIEVDDSRGNTILSPLSISLALAHLALGAANQTQKHLLEVLHMESVPCLHQALRGVTQHLHRTALSIAGRLFLEKGFPIKEKFLEASQRFYGAKPALLSGNSQADLEAINRWVEEATNGQISTMLTELPPNIVMVLLNAVYFRGFWKTKFNPLLTEPSLFHLDEESAVSVEMMKERDFPLSWFRTESLEAEVAKFPFKGNTSFVAIVPSLHLRKNFSQVLSEVLQLDLERFPKERSTMVKMPKMHLEDHVDLSGALTRLGLGELFSAPDLHHITEGPLVVSSIQHRAALELAEAGVQAAAATSVIAFRSISAFSLDQPFIFMITEDITGIPLFLGTIRNPSSGAPQEKKGQDPLESGRTLKQGAKGTNGQSSTYN